MNVDMNPFVSFILKISHLVVSQLQLPEPN